MPVPNQSKEDSICFQDLNVGNSGGVYQENSDKDHPSENCSAESLFEMANSSCVSYRICGHPNRTIVVRQDTGCQEHTGGIVWETAYLLASYLEQKFGLKNQRSSKYALGQTLEVRLPIIQILLRTKVNDTAFFNCLYVSSNDK